MGEGGRSRDERANTGTMLGQCWDKCWDNVEDIQGEGVSAKKTIHGIQDNGAYKILTTGHSAKAYGLTATFLHICCCCCCYVVPPAPPLLPVVAGSSAFLNERDNLGLRSRRDSWTRVAVAASSTSEQPLEPR